VGSSSDLVLGVVLTWVLGLAPAVLARYAWKRAPLSSRSATLIAGISCGTFALGFMVARAAAGGPERISLAWIMVFIVSRWIMRRGSREYLLSKLREMIADPETSEERRALALDRLDQLARSSPAGNAARRET